ncbi:MAG: hypothetical protein KA126_05720 [Candidatus Hydrothermae bacterium]|nr:hypothetical protein [Candidatus Hydrothermae bacterium]MDD3649638.1 hypothetical protein [Candidatus Hydrothermia bacterium]HOK23548.1 hypothetical protein [Candidatus Hydrothermia bacterium]HOL24223.1 hypothetical protein [Candidatus Hydrothermia bacterium]HPO79206.1 hypothetical protein [Candidatus Hydrothermia bacterium]
MYNDRRTEVLCLNCVGIFGECSSERRDVEQAVVVKVSIGQMVRFV